MSKEGIILEVTVKGRPAPLQSLESKPQEVSLETYTYNLHESWPTIGEDERKRIQRVFMEIDEIIKKEFPKTERVH